MSEILYPVGPAPETRDTRVWLLIAAASAAPLFWLGQTMLGYGVSTYACYPGDHLLPDAAGGSLHLFLMGFDAIALLGALAGSLLAFRLWRAAPAKARNRFLAGWAVFSSLWFVIAILFNILITIGVPLCAT